MRTFHGKDPKPADQRKFSQAARTILARRTTVQAFTWTPRVKDTERDAFEQAGKEQNGPDFTIRELDAHHNLVPAKRRAEYYPILYREPQPDNPKAMGFDVASEADRLEALQRAGETAEPVASSPLTPKSPGNNNEATLLVFLPIYRDGIARDQPLDRRQTIRGYVIAVLRMGRLVELAWEGFNSEGIHFWLYDETSSSHKRFAFYRGSERGLSETLPSAEEMQALTTAIQRTTSIHAAGRQWTLRFVQTPQYLAAHRSLQAWSVLAGGMLFTGLLGGVLVVVTGRTALIAGLVKQRTTQLAEANAAMVQEIAQRHRLEQEVLEIAALEQRRIGQELHDGVGQELTGLCMLADDLAEVLGERSAEQAQMAHRIAQSLKSALAQVRALSRGLIPVEVDAEGLMAALTELTDRIGKLHDISCTFEYLEPVLVEDNFTATQLYRIAQEAITNALKHSKADNIRVSLEIRDRCLTLRIADDGIGLTELVKRLEGMGLHIMKYRASQIGAQLSIRPGPAGGTIVTCTLLRENECVERC
jgi:signal transduction histidine kinase